ncbi:MAG: DinB family protein [Candidatus Thorarchaeota archaeon]|nr:MAG: DinB family protein [Candidatus Thorarchaeota archaeon]
MLYEFLQNAALRHFYETRPLIDQIDDNHVLAIPIEGGRPLGEVILHLIRSIEFYLRGLIHNEWRPLPYSLEEYQSAAAIRALYEEVIDRARDYIEQLSHTDLSQVNESFNRPATKAEILLEMIEHSIHHRGQITVYFRLIGIEVSRIHYII